METHAAAPAGTGIKAPAIVLDPQFESIPHSLEADPHHAGVGMFDRVVERLLGDPVQFAFDRDGQPPLPLDSELGLQAGATFDGRQARLQCGD